MGPGISRRTLLQAASAAGVGTALGAPGRALGQGKKRLRILQWNHFVPAFDKWFAGVYAREWGEKNDTEVIVDNVGIPALNSTAAAEVAARSGHDLYMFLRPRPVYENDVIDHRELYEECTRKYGKPIDLAIKSTYNPRTKKYHGFSDSFAPDPINYRKDLWDDVGMAPESWDAVRVGGGKIKQKTGIPVGIGLSAEDDTAAAVRAILYSFGASEQDSSGNLVLGSRETVEAVKFVKALYQETMSPEVLAWDPSSNNRAMLAGKTSLVLNAISITRAAEKDRLPVGERIWLARPPRGPVRRMGLEHATNVYVIWKFSQNIEGAKRFLVDYVGSSREAFQASQFYNFPCFPGLVPDLASLIGKDSRANPPDKYAVLSDALEWAATVGYPGYSSAAVDEVYSTWVLNSMFAQAATGTLSPEDAVKEAERKCRRIWEKWKERRLI